MEWQNTELEGVYQLELPTPFPVGPVNVYLIEGDVLTLVDAGPKSEEAWFAFCESLDRLGYKPEDIDQVILTHHHPDHVGLLHYFPEQTKIIGHYKNKPWICKDERFIKQNELFFKNFFISLGIDKRSAQSILLEMEKTYHYSCDKRFLTTELKEGDVVPGLPGWVVFETPGHAGSHIVLFHEREGVLIGGDLLIEHMSPNPFIEAPYDGETGRSKSLLLYNQSLEKCLQLDMKFVLSGHGKRIDNPYSLIHNQLKKQEERAQRIYDWLHEKPMTAFELSNRLFSGPRYKNQLSLTTSVTVGQLDFLENKQVITVDKTKDVWKYSIC